MKNPVTREWLNCIIYSDIATGNIYVREGFDFYDKFKEVIEVKINNPLETQVGGSHYKDLKIQPIEFIHANNIDFISANIIKYAARHKSKNKDEDMKKIIHYALLGLQLIYDYNGEEIKELLKSFANEKV
jgi:hypothetical protein